MDDYKFETKPYKHQLDDFLKYRDRKFHADLSEQGTGKTKTSLDIVAYQFLKKNIDGLLIVAPNGVHLNWITDEIPVHFPKRIPHLCITFFSSLADRKYMRKDLAKLMAFDGLAILAMSYDSWTTKKGFALGQDFLKRRKVYCILDEAVKIKNEKAIRAKRLNKIKKLPKYKRILTGTPVANSPFDIFNPFNWLSNTILKIQSFYSFKNFFAEWDKGFCIRNGEKKEFPVLKEYKNLDKLKKWTDPYSNRNTKDQCLDLPPKIFKKIYVELSKEEQRHYENLRKLYIAFTEKGESCTASMALTRILRLQEITCGFMTSDEDRKKKITFKDQSKIKKLLELVEDVGDEKFIVWARFEPDIDLISKKLGEAGIKYVQYYGKVSNNSKDNKREKAKKSFQEGDAQAFVATAACASEGLTLHSAKHVFYYSCSFKLLERLQSEDRAHRSGLKHKVTYNDLISFYIDKKGKPKKTVDEKIVEALRKKNDIARIITGDNYKEWI